MKSAIAWMAENHVAANLLMAFFVVAGIVMALSIKLEVFPEYSLDIITITIKYRGASPSEVESGALRQIEEKIAGLAGIKRIDSVAREGYGTVSVEVMSDWDVTKLLDEIKAAVDRISTLPEEAEEPIVREATRRNQVINVVVYGDAPEAAIKTIAQRVRDDITDLPDITLAEFFGVRSDEIQVEISENTLRRYGLSFGQIANAVNQASLDMPAGSVKTTGGEILIRTKGRRYYAEDFRDIPVVSLPDGSQVLLDQLGDIRESFEDIDYFARFQGKPAAMIQVYRVADQNAITVADQVKEYIEKVKTTLPHGVEIDFYQDMSKILKSRLNLLLRNIAMGLVLVALLLAIFMSVKLAFWVTLGIPISFLSALIFLPDFDISINMVSLFAFIMVLGIVVDDAIIIGENIFSKQQQGLPKLRAAVEGAIEVGTPVVFSVLTTVAAFWPLLLGAGMMGKIMRNIPVVIILVLLGSLVESLFILPAHLAGNPAGFSKIRKKEKEKTTARMLAWFINGPYARLVSFCISWRYAVIALGVGVLLLAVGTWTGGIIKLTFFPKVEGDVLSAALTMPVGAPAGQTTGVIRRLEDSAVEALGEMGAESSPASKPLFQKMISILGLQMSGHGGNSELGSHLAQVWVQTLDGEERTVSAEEMTKAWRKKMGPVPEADSLVFQSDLFRAGNPIEIHLSTPDQEALIEAADEFKAKLKTYNGVHDITDSFQPGKKEFQIKLKPAAETMGISLSDLAAQVRYAFYGVEAVTFQRDQDEVDVLIRYPENERKSLGDIEEMMIRTQDGLEIPFNQAAEVTLVQGYSSIQRAQRRRVIKVMAEVDEKTANADEIRQDLEKNFLPKLAAGHPGLRYDMEGEGKEQKESLTEVFRGFAIALFCIYALLAIPFKSFTQPVIVMAAIPFGLAGALAGHLLMGFNLSFISLFGMVGLAGVVVNDSLVLIDQANRLRRAGKNAVDAVSLAGRMRFRAILLTSLTTFAGLTPMLLEKSLQAQFLIPMAVSLGFGVLFSTLVTLLLVPCMYTVLDDFHNLIAKIGGRSIESPQQDAGQDGSTPPRLAEQE